MIVLFVVAGASQIGPIGLDDEIVSAGKLGGSGKI
jgi:hypothetical protein